VNGAFVIERPAALPRVFSVRDVALVPDVETALDRIEKASFRPRSQAVVVDPDVEREGRARSPSACRSSR
jgi:hypothetical protein